MNDRDKFYKVINQFNYLIPLWDQNRHELKEELFWNRVGTMSSGERHLALFMLCVWRGDNHYRFDFIEAMSIFSDSYKWVLVEWIKEPYWP